MALCGHLLCHKQCTSRLLICTDLRLLKWWPLTGHIATAGLCRTTEGSYMGPLKDDRLTVKTHRGLRLGGLSYCEGPAGSLIYTKRQCSYNELGFASKVKRRLFLRLKKSRGSEFLTPLSFMASSEWRVVDSQSLVTFPSSTEQVPGMYLLTAESTRWAPRAEVIEYFHSALIYWILIEYFHSALRFEPWTLWLAVKFASH